ncbi:hypothetical protein E1B28_001461 [Marasmius oreades]|uniref:Sugar phosphate transporter domain-containing protein n=1 Tax=Marasmius oreades TaxID=181124 RepID=A0A9P7V3G8_9AGAR|nr:uncharacterized protein E1B28_001461 [Marasmius oreades]KAG7099635.1 hypothetical protein E1B28_001461 [Marasmius oreades]
MISLNSNTLKVAGVVTFYMSAALVMVFVNKAVLDKAPELPLLFLFNQLLIAVVLLRVAAASSKHVEIPRYDLSVAKKLVPVVTVNIVGLVFNTLCLRGVEASFFQIARGMQLPLTIFISSLNTRSTPSPRTVGAAIIVTLGFFLGVAPSSSIPITASPSILSLFYGLLSSLFIAIHAVLIKSSLPHCNNSTIKLAWWTNAGSAVLLLPFIVLNGELRLVYEMIQRGNHELHIFGWGSLVTGVFGFLLCVAGLLSIKVTSPVTHMFSSAARSVIQTLLGVLIFHDLLTINRGASIFVILCGTMYFTWVKSLEQQPQPRQPVDLESVGRTGRNTEPKTDLDVVWEVDSEGNEIKK